MRPDSSRVTGLSPGVGESDLSMSFCAICRGIGHPCTGVGRCGCGWIHRRMRELLGTFPEASTTGVEERLELLLFGGDFDIGVEVVRFGLDRALLRRRVELVGVELAQRDCGGLGRRCSLLCCE